MVERTTNTFGFVLMKIEATLKENLEGIARRLAYEYFGAEPDSHPPLESVQRSPMKGRSSIWALTLTAWESQRSHEGILRAYDRLY